MSSASLQRIILRGVAALALALPLVAQTPDAATQHVGASAAAAPVLTPDAGGASWNAGPYAYDASGNIVGIGGGLGDQSFRYDVNGRLVTSTITGPLGSTSEQFSYDAYANMLSHTIDGTTTSYPTTSSTNHLTSGINAAYDAAGNMTQWQPPGTTVVYHYSFDALHMMTESNATNTSGGAYSGAHRVIHVYTADDERAWTYDLTANESHWRIRGLDGKVLRDFDNTGTTWTAARDYLYRDGALLGAITPTGSEHYTLDHLGTPRFITDGSGNQIGLHTYRPFGQEWSVTDPTQEGNPLRFTGHERDADSLAGGANGLDYMHARFYDGPVGRFLSMDPIGGDIRTTSSWNGYAYVQNSPMVFSDPTGALRDGAGNQLAQQVPNVDCPAGSEEGISCFVTWGKLIDDSHWHLSDLLTAGNAAVERGKREFLAWSEALADPHLILGNRVDYVTLNVGITTPVGLTGGLTATASRDGGVYGGFFAGVAAPVGSGWSLTAGELSDNARHTAQTLDNFINQRGASVSVSSLVAFARTWGGPNSGAASFVKSIIPGNGTAYERGIGSIGASITGTAVWKVPVKGPSW